jgi:hypothetical protein
MTASSPRIAVYSCYFGHPEPFNVHALGDGNGYDRILFTDRTDIAPSGIVIKYCDSRALGPAFESRRAKMLPHRMLEGYDFAIYVDNRASLIATPIDIFSTTGAGETAGLYVFKHPDRSTAAEELDTCLLLRHVREDQWKKLHALYHDTGLPDTLSLTHNAVMLYHLGNARTQTMSELWWELFLTYSMRDQLTMQLAEHLSGQRATRLNIPLSNVAQWPVFQPEQRAVSPSHKLKKPPIWTIEGLRYRKERKRLRHLIATRKSQTAMR